jgi:uncharacterized protein YjiK
MVFLFFILSWFIAGSEGLPEIKGYDFADKKITSLKLPKELSEASGLAFAGDSRLLCHNDEQAIIYEIDYNSGAILKHFSLGKYFIYRADLEGIATKKDTIFIVSSDGVILRFLPGKDGAKILFQTFKTPLSIRNDVEGLAYDPVTDCLLLACKGEANTSSQNPLPADQKAVYAFSLKTYKLALKPRFLIPITKIIAATQDKEFAPSSIERHPRTGHFFVIAARGNAIAELDAGGNLLAVSSLPKSVHVQPEGLAIAPDGTLVICNEGQGKSGRLVVYSPQ